MNKINLGKLKQVELRSIWENEATEFTPWLAKDENLELLSEAIDIELVLDRTEKPVGPFNADILCKDVSNDNWVLIENQLEKTDHKHLGQLITYATGLNAVTIIWIASNFTEEHRAALDKLNEITPTSYNFFGIKMEAWCVDDSKPAPVFKVISKPNNWSRSISSATRNADINDYGETKKKQYKFWTELCSAIVNKNTSPLKVQKPSPKHWHTFSIGKSGVGLNMTFNSKEDILAVEIYIISDQSIFEYFDQDKDKIESELGEKLEWQPRPEKKASRIIIKRNNSVLENEKEWGHYISWSIDKLEKFHNIFGTRLKSL